MPGMSENERMSKMLDDLLAKLNENSSVRSQEDGASQARFAQALDQRITGDEEAAADDIYAAQYERQLPSQRQAMAMGRSDGSSRDELANYAMIMRGKRERAARPAGNGVRAVSRDVPSKDDTQGFLKDFQKDQATRARVTDMFGGKQHVNEADKQRILAEMAKGANATMAALSGPPAAGNVPGRAPTPSPTAQGLDAALPAYPNSPAYPAPQAPNGAALDEAALRERGMR